jgi:Domain of unknown function (DUF4328)
MAADESAAGVIESDRAASVRVGTARARWAAGAVFAVAACQAIPPVAMAFMSARGPVVMALRNMMAMTWMVPCVHVTAAVLYLRWIHRAVANAQRLGAPLGWTPRQAVTAYLIPFVNLFRPYRVMKALHAASDPSALPDAPKYRHRENADYRQGARELLEPTRWAFAAPIGAWWTLYMLDGLLGSFFMVVAGPIPGAVLSALCFLAAATLAVLVIRSVDARQRELLRRLESLGTHPDLRS